jgi:hypothetical protein
MRNIVAISCLLIVSNANAELCNGEFLQPGGESLYLSSYTVAQRANAISKVLYDGCANSTDLVGQKSYNAKWADDFQSELVTTCESSSGGRRQIIVTFESYPYTHARYKVAGQCEHIIQNAEEMKYLK